MSRVPGSRAIASNTARATRWGAGNAVGAGETAAARGGDRGGGMNKGERGVNRGEPAAERARVLGVALVVVGDLAVGAAHEARRIDDPAGAIDRLALVGDVVAERI